MKKHILIAALVWGCRQTEAPSGETTLAQPSATTALPVRALAATAPAGARDYISIVGSSTVYPFSTVVAEQFGKTSHFKTPKVESTGSGGGLKLFCGGVGPRYPDIASSSRRIKPSELADCEQNGVEQIVEVKIGHDGIVLASSRASQPLQLTLRQLWLALAKDVAGAEPGQLVANPHRKWSDIAPNLPDVKIEVLGPPPTSGTRDALVELALEPGCSSFAWLKALKSSDERRFKTICHRLREDGTFVEAGENDNLIVQKLQANPGALGIFGYSFLDQNADKLQAASIGGASATFETISNGSYPIARPLFMYVKKAHVGLIPGITEYLAELTQQRAWGPEGYLASKGMIPLSEAERGRVAETVTELIPLKQ